MPRSRSRSPVGERRAPSPAHREPEYSGWGSKTGLKTAAAPAPSNATTPASTASDPGFVSGFNSYVVKIPPCDLCAEWKICTPAKYDVALKDGTWGYVCEKCRTAHAEHTQLGMGKGQELMIYPHLR